MALYTYKKNKKNSNYLSSTDNLLLKEEKKVKAGNLINILSIPKGIYNDLLDISSKSKFAGIAIPLCFIALGTFFIYREFFPEIQSSIQSSSGYLIQGNILPVSDEYINLENYISKPQNFKELTIEALKEQTLEQDTKSINYNGTFYLSIPSIGINKLPVEANVDSTNENIYNRVLENKLAHFRSTSLPISDVKNNMLLYGHSASPNYNPRATDPEVAFSFLPNLKVGDDITIEIDGKKYYYKMFSSKIVKPTETSVITGTKGKHTLTLVTCFPLGSNENRYVAIARPV